jgi:hypothetical protein
MKKIITLKIEELQIDKHYQRHCIRQWLVDWIAAHFDPNALGFIFVARRTDGSLWVVDGQHRLLAVEKLGWTHVDCEVFDSQGRRHEAVLFRERNGDRAKVSSLEMFKAGVTGRDPEAVAILATVEEQGYKIGKTGGGRDDKMIECVGTLQSIYRAGGCDLLRTVLRIINAAWPFRAGYKTECLAGLAHFIQHVVEYSEDRLIDKLKGEDPSRLSGYAKASARFTIGWKRGEVFGDVVLNIYNRGLRKKLCSAK